MDQQSRPEHSSSWFQHELFHQLRQCQWYWCCIWNHVGHIESTHCCLQSLLSNGILACLTMPTKLYIWNNTRLIIEWWVWMLWDSSVSLTWHKAHVWATLKRSSLPLLSGPRWYGVTCKLKQFYPWPGKYDQQATLLHHLGVTAFGCCLWALRDSDCL